MPGTWTNWVVSGGDLTNPEFVDLPEKPLMQPFPLSVWQCDPLVDEGEVSCPLFPDWVRLEITPVKQMPYVVVFNVTTPQAQLQIPRNNGMAILTPTSCEETEELCGMWSVKLEHPIDPEGRYKMLLVGNIIRANGQLFTIKQTDEQYNGSTGSVSVYAEHIWYQLGDGWIYSDPFEPTQIYEKSAQAAINSIISHTRQEAMSGGQVYNFTGNSGMYYDTTYYAVIEEGCTPIDLILGESGIIAAKGGELHRDNFYFSVKPRKETARDNAFDIRVGKNLTGIRRNIDTTTMCTYFSLMDRETGAGCSWAWDGTVPVMRNLIPHHTIRARFTSYPEGTIGRFIHLCQDGEMIFNRYCRPLIGYEIDLEDTRMNQDFGMTADESIRCGDSGRVYDERLGGEIQLEVTETVYDRITGKCKRFTVGDKHSFVYHPSAPAVFPFTPEFQGGELWVKDSTGRYLYDAAGRKIVMEVTEIVD